MIIFGTRGVTMTKTSGQFFCPNCAGNSGFRHRRVRRFFTLYFIPVIPLDLLGEYIECDQCGGTFEEAVLSINPAEFEQAMQSSFSQDVMRVMILTMIADGTVAEEELEAIQNFVVETGGDRPTSDQLSQEVAMAREAGISAVDYIRDLAPSLSDDGKKLVVKAAFVVASATGNLQDPQRVQLEQMPDAVGITQEQFRQIVSGVS